MIYVGLGGLVARRIQKRARLQRLRDNFSLGSSTLLHEAKN